MSLSAASASLLKIPRDHGQPLPWAACPDVMGYPFGQLGSAVPAMSLPKLLLTNNILSFERGRSEGKKVVLLCKTRSTVAKRLVCYQHCFSNKCKVQMQIGHYEFSSLHNVIPAQHNSASSSTSLLLCFSFIYPEKAARLRISPSVLTQKICV